MAPAPNKKFRVLVVDDSAFMRKVLEAIFNADDQLQVVGHAKDGREAISLAESLKPDIITMDINMPHMDGLQATAQIMTTNPRPIVIVSSDSKDGSSSALSSLSPSLPAASTSTCNPSKKSYCARCAWPPRFASCVLLRVSPPPYKA
jgi:chemotaxis response regulator CheB